MFSFSEIKKILEIDDLLPEDKWIQNIHFDSREIKKNGLFIALPGGEEYIEQAVKNGAILVLTEKETNKESVHLSSQIIKVPSCEKALQTLAQYYRKKLRAKVIAVTGSNGKTTTKDSIAHVLSENFRVHKTKGNFNNHLGLPLTILQTPFETEVLILEMGMNHSGEIDFLSKLAKPDWAVISNIGESHIEFLGSKENIAHAKGEVLGYLPEDGLALLPGDSEFLPLLKGKSSCKTISVGIQSDNDIYPKKIIQTLSGMKFSLYDEPFFIPLFGYHNVSNVSFAIFIAKELGIPVLQIKKRLENLTITGMRFEKIPGPNHSFMINDAYNASPTSMIASIDTFLRISDKRKKVLVLGDMFELGSENENGHLSVGYFLEENKGKIEFLITIGQRSKNISRAYNGLKRHFGKKEEAHLFVKNFLSEDFSLFFKASRGMKFDLLIKSLFEF